MKFISLSFIAILINLFMSNPGIGISFCSLYECEDQLEICIFRENCNLEIGKKKKNCIKKKCKYNYDDCIKNCKGGDDDEDDKGGF